ncbi:hypothetical protein BOX15_Mlig023701g5 [Macrostomum lignano]|uniref:Uncharacterized protein n=1 Tax=Macrostomum lignano TaxID=282301 RepID=A0A267DRE0_9PLAT|nr:hypothetical protein BOX15_Mlig023701g5 [Macrostomum lignano]
MIRTTAGSNLGGKGAGFDAAPLALWTTRQPGGTGQQPALNSNFISSRSGPAAASGQFHLPFPMAGRLPHRHRRGGGPPAGRTVGERQIEVLTRLPSLYSKIHSNVPQPQQQQQKQQPEPLPLLHGSKRMKKQQQQQIQQQQQQQKQKTPTALDAEPGTAEPASEPSDAPRSRFRISVADQVPQEQRSVESQKQQKQKQQQPRSVPMAYFSRGSASLHSTCCDDVDTRSCDRRHPDQTVAYSRAAVYIRDNELMPAAKARLIWRWMDELEHATPSASRLFVYDPGSRWFSMAA